jgi:hypothetical protein
VKLQDSAETSKKEILDAIEVDLKSIVSRINDLMDACKSNPLHRQMGEQMAQAAVVIKMGIDAMRAYERLVNEGGSRAEA